MTDENRSTQGRPLTTPVANKQRGMSMTMIMITMAVVVFFGMFAFKVGPHYLEYMTVKSIAEDVAGNSDLLRKPRSKVNKYINQAYQTNNLWDMKAADTIELKKDGDRGYVVTVKYEKRATLFRNIDLVTSFDTEATGH